MTCYSIEPRGGIFVKGYGFLSFFKKNIVKILSGVYRLVKKLLMMLNNLLQVHLKLHPKE